MRIVSYTRTTCCFPGKEAPSITEQNEHIAKYALAHGFKIADKYSDRKKDKNANDGFQCLLQDGIHRKFDAVIVDSVFLAGKDLWNAKETLLETFHCAGIGFIVVEDDFSSIGKSVAEAERYFEEKYGQLRSETIRTQVLARNKSGVLSWNDGKYGYRIENNTLVIDPETAPVVKRIFEMCAEGLSIRKVAEILSAEKVPSPLSKRGTNVEIADPYKWTRLSIRRLLDKTVYIGYWTKNVQGESVFFENEPIVSKELFAEAQKAIVSPTYTAKKPSCKHAFAGLLWDKDFGACFVYRVSRSGVRYFVPDKKAKRYDQASRILYEQVEDAVRQALSEARQSAIRMLDFIYTDGNTDRDLAVQRFREEYQKRAHILAEKQAYCMELYGQFQNGIITETEKDAAIRDFNAYIAEIEPYFSSHADEIRRLELLYGENNPWVQLYLSWDENSPMENKLLKRYVSRIVIENAEHISVELQEQDWYINLPTEWREHHGKKKQEN